MPPEDMSQAPSNLARLEVIPVSQRAAFAFISEHHRHHTSPRGWKFGCGLTNGTGVLLGVVVAGRPVARNLDDGFTIEVTRHCTLGTPNAASKLYGAIRRAAFALGYKRVVTYTLATESGHSLRVSGFQNDGAAGGGTWSRRSRVRTDPNPTEKKIRWISFA